MSILKIYELSGNCGVALILLAIVAIYFSVRSYFFTSVSWANFKSVFINAKSNKERCLKDYEGVNPFLNIIYQMVTTHQSHTDDLRAEVVYLFNKNFRVVTNSLTILKLIAVISPLLGLLGTVLGMISVFEAISLADTQDPAMLASGIYKALITTVLGMCVAIPTLVVFYLLSMRMKIFMMETIEHTYQAISSFNKIANKSANND